MTSQRLMKLFALVALGAVLATFYLWRTTGDDPSPWLIRLALASFFVAFVLFVVNPHTRPRIMLQFLAALFATMALFTFAADYSATPSAGGGFTSSSLLERLNDFAPSLVASSREAIVSALGQAVWDPVLTTLLGMPAYLFFLILGALAGYAGRYRRDVQIFIN